MRGWAGPVDTRVTGLSRLQMLSVKLHLNGQTDKHQGRQSRIYETAGSLEPTQNVAFFS